MNLRTEKEDLIERLNKSNKIIIKLNKEIGKYEQCLDEIEEICTHETINLTDSCVNGGRYVKILEKIKEVKEQ